MKRRDTLRPDLIDLHLYGGAFVMSAGFAMLALWAGAVAFGVVLMALGLRMPPQGP